VEIAAGLLRHPAAISVDGSEACEDFPYVFEVLSINWLIEGSPRVYQRS
jgi:hypothetical protein